MTTAWATAPDGTACRGFIVIARTAKGKGIRYPTRNIEDAVALMDTLASRGVEVQAYTAGHGVEELIGLEELRGLIP